MKVARVGKLTPNFNNEPAKGLRNGGRYRDNRTHGGGEEKPGYAMHTEQARQSLGRGHGEHESYQANPA